MIEKIILKVFGPVYAFVSSSFNRYRLRGFRVQIICAVISQSDINEILLVKSRYENAWMPPQEGVNQDEEMSDAIWRCLSVECGINIPDDKTTRDRKFHVRYQKFVGALKLPNDRDDNRHVVDNAAGTIFENIPMTGKAYWVATILLNDKESVNLKPNGVEVVEAKWIEISQALNMIDESNRVEKANLLTGAIKNLASALHLDR